MLYYEMIFLCQLTLNCSIFLVFSKSNVETSVMSSKILIIGACGQIGSELTYKLREIYGHENVIASDINYNNLEVANSGLFEIVDAEDYASVKVCVEKHNIDTVYLMAAML